MRGRPPERASRASRRPGKCAVAHPRRCERVSGRQSVRAENPWTWVCGRAWACELPYKEGRPHVRASRTEWERVRARERVGANSRDMRFQLVRSPGLLPRVKDSHSLNELMTRKLGRTCGEHPHSKCERHPRPKTRRNLGNRWFRTVSRYHGAQAPRAENTRGQSLQSTIYNLRRALGLALAAATPPGAPLLTRTRALVMQNIVGRFARTHS